MNRESVNFQEKREEDWILQKDVEMKRWGLEASGGPVGLLVLSNSRSPPEFFTCVIILVSEGAAEY